MLVTTCLADRLRRIDRRPLASVGLAAMVALGLIYLNRPLIRERARFVSLHADQRSVMKVLDRLAVVAHAFGVSRAQVLQAFDPIEPRWCYPGGNILKMLPETSAKPRLVKNPQETRTLLLSWIPPEEQAVLFSSTNLTSQLFPADVGPKSVSRHPAACGVLAVEAHGSARSLLVPWLARLSGILAAHGLQSPCRRWPERTFAFRNVGTLVGKRWLRLVERPDHRAAAFPSPGDNQRLGSATRTNPGAEPQSAPPAPTRSS